VWLRQFGVRPADDEFLDPAGKGCEDGRHSILHAEDLEARLKVTEKALEETHAKI
jgi:hypothetical protein